QHRRHGPTKRFLMSTGLSLFGHVALLILLIEFPGLFHPGMNYWFRSPSGSGTQSAKEPEWRPLAYLGNLSRMQAPSPETLRRNVYDWKKRASRSSPPIRIRWGDEASSPKDAREQP